MGHYYSITQATEILNVSREVLKKWIDEKKIKVFRFPGGKDRITREKLIEFMKKHSISTELFEDRHQGIMRVVIVDDEQDVLELLAESLAQTGTCRVMTAETGFEAGLIIKKFRPHVIVLDIKLKDGDGRELCQLIQGQSDLSKIKMIGISGKISRKEEDEIIGKGFQGFLRKPFDMEEFRDTVLNV
jgi:excisionase family DNA binding protein